MTSRNQEHKLRGLREYINEDLLDCYNLLRNKIKDKSDINSKKLYIKCLIKRHKKVINKTNIYGKNKYHTLSFLVHYLNTQDSSIAMHTLTNSLNNRNLFNHINK
jgi:hypothetical protein